MNNPSNTYLFFINDGPYRNGRPHNTFHHSLNLIKHPETSMREFMIGDGVQCALANQKTPDGYYNIEQMLKSLARRGEVAT